VRLGLIHTGELGTGNYPGDAHCKFSKLDKPGEAPVAMADVSMAPVFPTTLAVVGAIFLAVTGIMICFAITCGWIGLAVNSRVIGEWTITTHSLPK
jgi:hypothetical protein